MNVHGVIEGQLNNGLELSGSVTPAGTVAGAVNSGGHLNGSISVPGQIALPVQVAENVCG